MQATNIRSGWISGTTNDGLGTVSGSMCKQQSVYLPSGGKVPLPHAPVSVRSIKQRRPAQPTADATLAARRNSLSSCQPDSAVSRFRAASADRSTNENVSPTAVNYISVPENSLAYAYDQPRQRASFGGETLRLNRAWPAALETRDAPYSRAAPREPEIVERHTSTSISTSGLAMPRFRFASTSASSDVPQNTHGNIDTHADSTSQTRGLLDFLNSRIARTTKSTCLNGDPSTPSPTAAAPAPAATAPTLSLTLHLSYRSSMNSVRVAPSAAQDMASLRLLFASVFRLDNVHVRDLPIYMKVAASSQQPEANGKQRGAMFKLISLVSEIPNGAVLLLVDDRQLFDAVRPCHGQNQSCQQQRASSVASGAGGRCTCEQPNGHAHAAPFTLQCNVDNNTLTRKIGSVSQCASQSSSISSSSQNISEPTAAPSTQANRHACSGSINSLTYPQSAAAAPTQPATTSQPVIVPTLRVRAQPIPNGPGPGRPPVAPVQRDLVLPIASSDSRERETLRRVAERARVVNSQLRGVKDDLRELRRAALSFRNEMNELFATTQRELRTLLVLVPGAQHAPLRRARYDVDMLFGSFERDERRTLTDLADLRIVVDELRMQVVTGTTQRDSSTQAFITESDSGMSSESGSSQAASNSAAGRPVLLNAVELEAYSLQLEKSLAELQVNKREFPTVLDRLKSVMVAETQQLVREEQFLKTHDTRLTEALQKCQQLATLLITLKRMCALQKFDRANSLLASGDGGINETASAAAVRRVRQRLTLITDPNPSHATKRAILENIEAICPNSDERVRAIEHNEALHRIRKRFMAAYANLQMEKLLRDKLAASSKSTDSSNKLPDSSNSNKEPDAIDVLFSDVEKLLAQLDFVRLQSVDDDDDDDEASPWNDKDAASRPVVAATKAGSVPPNLSDAKDAVLARSMTSGSMVNAVAKPATSGELESNSESSSQETVICNDIHMRNASVGVDANKKVATVKSKSSGKWRLLSRSKHSDKKDTESEATLPQADIESKDRLPDGKKERRRRSRSSSTAGSVATVAEHAVDTNAKNDANNNTTNNGIASKQDAVANRIVHHDALVFI